MTARISFRLTEYEKNYIQKIAFYKKTTVSNVMRGWVSQHIRIGDLACQT